MHLYLVSVYLSIFVDEQMQSSIYGEIQAQQWK